jgi:hypothetical protein
MTHQQWKLGPRRDWRPGDPLYWRRLSPGAHTPMFELKPDNEGADTGTAASWPIPDPGHDLDPGPFGNAS